MSRHVAGEYSTTTGGGLGSDCCTSSLHSHNSRWESSHNRRSRGAEDRRIETCEDEGMQEMRSFFRGRVEGKGTNNNSLRDRHYSSFNRNESSMPADSVLPPGGGTEEGRLTSTKVLNPPELLPQCQGLRVDRMEMFPGAPNETINATRVNYSSETARPPRGPDGHPSLPPPSTSTPASGRVETGLSKRW